MDFELLKLCILIFCCRIMDVSLGTVRTIATVKGNKYLASLIGFVEILIWFLVVREALNTNETSIFVAIAYAGGYATGTLVGTLLAQRFIRTKIVFQVITSTRDELVLEKLHEEGYAFTVLEAYGYNHKNEKFMLVIEIDNNKINDLKKFILSLDEKAFITIKETKSAINGYYFSNKHVKKK